MSRKLTLVALAMAVAGGVYLSGAPAHASNMGFKLERNFRVERDAVSGAAFQNLYWLSFPLFNGLGDTAHTVGDGVHTNKCVGDSDPAFPGQPVGDGIINADDAICDLWSGRLRVGGCPQCIFTISHFVNDQCFESARSASFTFTGNIAFGGTFIQPLNREEGYKIIVGAQAPNTVNNNAVVVGSHDPSYAGQTIHVFCSPQQYWLNLPYHTMYQHADEVLCGLFGTGNDWVDDNNNTTGAPPSDGKPDTCPNGVYDNVTVHNSSYALTLQTFDNVLDGTGPGGTNSDNTFLNRTISFNFTGIQYTGVSFNLIPGDAYQLLLPRAGHADTLWLTPHF